MSKPKLHAYQQRAFEFLLDRLSSQKGGGLFFEPGLGKTLTTLKVLEKLKADGVSARILIVAPLRVIYNVWPAEIEKWGFDFTHAIVHGGRKKREALAKDVDIYLINPEGIPWLADEIFTGEFDTIVVDESTKFKTWGAKRTKALRQILRSVKKRIILTGTPAPNTLIDLHSQVFIVDDGETLGQTVSKFRLDYCQRGGFEGRQWEMRPERIKPLEDAVAPLCLYGSAVEELDMPDLIHNPITVEMPAKAAKTYKKVETEMFAELADGNELMATSAGSKYLLCRQIANGAAYEYSDPLDGTHAKVPERKVISVHDAKVEALADLYDELNGKQLLVAYQFNHDLQAIQRKFPKIRSIKGGTTQREMAETLKLWKKGDVGMLAVQSQALSHGVDGFQEACNDVCWFGLTDQSEIHDQLNARVFRQGVTGQVRIHYLITAGTVDRAVLRRLRDKAAGQQRLLDTIQAYRKEVENGSQD
jgi:nucleoside-triphosphatase THEP1